MTPTSPATKEDLHELEMRIDRRITALEAKVESFKDEVLRHFDVVSEANRHDLLGIHRDRIESLVDARTDHEVRIKRLERVAGVVAA